LGDVLTGAEASEPDLLIRIKAQKVGADVFFRILNWEEDTDEHELDG
jgi:hypothetical protein